MENKEARPYESAEAMNKALLALYESRLSEINDQITQCKEQCGWLSEGKIVSKPFFMKVDEAYLSAPKKILFVGRETFGWWQHEESDKAEELMKFYNQTTLNGRHYNSPF